MNLPYVLRLRGSRLGEVAPVPFVGAASILIALIIFTPILFANGPSPLSVRPELVVYRVSGEEPTQFDVRGVGVVAYSSIDLWVGTGFPWKSQCPSSGVEVNWSYDNQSNLPQLNVTTTANPVVVDAVVTYDQSGSPTKFAGDLAFYIVNPEASDESLSIVPCSSTPGLSVQSSIPSSQLPLPILLVNYGSAGPP